MYHKIKSLYIKTFSWEYWPMWLIYFPASLYYVYLSIKARSFFFFSATNPSIETGGMFFESKWEIFQLIPQSFYPSTLYVEYGENITSILNKLNVLKMQFPLIVKPDKGEKGWCVKKIHSIQELIEYKSYMTIPFLIQEYVDYPLEFSIFYYRNPSQQKGVITSVTKKKMLTVTGDGITDVGNLIRRNKRAFLQYKRLQRMKEINFQHVPAKGESIVLVPYGNHVLGAMFLDYNHVIDESLTDFIDSISKKIDGFYYGRYDLRCSNLEDLKMGKNFFILELNGSGAQPAHIYDPNFSFFKAQSVLIKHFRMMYEAAADNKRRGISFMSYQSFKKQESLKRNINRKSKLYDFTRHRNWILRVSFPWQYQSSGVGVISDKTE